MDELVADLRFDWPVCHDAHLVEQHRQEQEELLRHKHELLCVVHVVLRRAARQKVNELKAIQERREETLGCRERHTTLLEEQVLVVHNVPHPHRVAVVVGLRPDRKPIANPHVASDLRELHSHTHGVLHQTQPVVLVQHRKQCVDALHLVQVLESLGKEPVHRVVEADGLRRHTERHDVNVVALGLGA